MGMLQRLGCWGIVLIAPVIAGAFLGLFGFLSLWIASYGGH